MKRWQRVKGKYGENNCFFFSYTRNPTVHVLHIQLDQHVFGLTSVIQTLEAVSQVNISDIVLHLFNYFPFFFWVNIKMTFDHLRHKYYKN